MFNLIFSWVIELHFLLYELWIELFDFNFVQKNNLLFIYETTSKCCEKW